ncbi:MAG TPA: Gfo/Idh/MocA family oxidoreductase [Bryobacteraceae bacterium]|jgi:predicted dehydrogenase
MSDQTIGRRDLFRGAKTAAATAIAAASYSRILGANDRIQMGLIGCGERGRFVLSQFIRTDRVDVNAVCDIFGDNMAKAKQEAPKAAEFGDHRKLLESKNVDAVLIATPDHWHAGCAIDALNAGKDVYCEKPLTLKIEEGPAIVKAARINERVCQVGMQQRSGIHYIAAKQKFVDGGLLGKITLCRTWWHGNTYHLRKAPASMQQLPSNLNWARFLGPLKWRDYDPQQYWNWRAYLDFGGGQVTDLFTHWIDVVHMYMGYDVPSNAVSSGGIYAYKDGRTAPDTINVLLEYPGEYTATFEATLVPGITGYGIEFCGTKGKLFIDRGGYSFKPVGGGPADEFKVTGRQDVLTIEHVKNFLDCVVSRKKPNGDVLIGARSAQASHLGNIAYMQKRRIDFDIQREEILPF